MKTILSIIYFLSISLAFGQQPAHFFIGEEELEGIDIYDLHQDKGENYWISTNNGLYKFDGYNFKKLECKEMLSQSLFYVCEDKNGYIYCNNLNGQIFQIINDSCSLFYQVPDSLMSNYIGINIDNTNSLIVLSNVIFRLNEQKEPEILNKNIKGYLEGAFFTTTDSSLVFSDNSKLYRIKDNKCVYQDTFNGEYIPHFFDYKDDLIGYDCNTAELIFKNNKFIENPRFSQFERRKIYFDGEYIWDAKLVGGAKVKTISGKTLFNKNVVLGKNNISSLLRDKEGNIIIGTFGEGLIIIPNIYSTSYQLPDAEDRPTVVAKGQNSSLFIGTLKGKIYLLDKFGAITLLGLGNDKQIDCLSYLNEVNKLLVDSKITSTEVGLNEEELLLIGSLKGMYRVETGKYLIATNIGLYWFYPQKKQDKIHWVDNFSGRSNCLAYDLQNKTIYAGTSQGLKIGNSKKAEYFEISGKPLLCNDLHFYDNKMYICTQNEGILIFENGNLLRRWNISFGLPSNYVDELIQYENDFIISTNRGIFILSNEGKVLQTIKQAEGITTTKATDIEVVDNYLFVVHQKGMQKIDLSKLNKKEFDPKIELNKLFINDHLHKGVKNDLSLLYTQNKLSFELQVNTLKYTPEISYKYRIKGIDNNWQYNDYQNNLITYKSLPTGAYRFEYSAICRGVESQIHFIAFEICVPFWRTWWFFTLIFAAIIFASYTVYVVQLKRQQKISLIEQEAVESKLIAIQSQMNPHFIFNSLNSIQDLVLREEGESAYVYINKFAFLVRQTLNFTDLDFIDIDQEVKVLQVYLELEKLRFKEDFTFNLNVNVEDEIELPPMIIQPFIENAIKHGLLHKRGKKVLTVDFKQKEDLLLCEVFDNGVGRQKSKEINLRKSSQHASFSVKSIQTRFEILKKIFGGKLGVEFIDIMENNKAMGTKVIVHLPFKRKY